MNKENLRLAESVRGHLKECVPSAQIEPASHHAGLALLFHLETELPAAPPLLLRLHGTGACGGNAQGAHSFNQNNNAPTVHQM